MANQLNYPNGLSSTEFQRPSRILQSDIDLIQSGSQEILFGTRLRDNVEVWAYNPDGSFAAHTVIRPDDSELTLATVIDTGGANEILNIDVKTVALNMGLSPGRYAMVFNFFRDEVGSEDSYKLYISDISSDRTEVKLQLLKDIPSSIKDIYEFVVPSVPKLYAQALIDQVFGKSLDALPQEKITPDKLLTVLSDVRNRVIYSDSQHSYDTLVNKLVDRAHTLILEEMAGDIDNFNIQYPELIRYIEDSLDVVITDMIQKGEIDPRFNING